MNAVIVNKELRASANIKMANVGDRQQDEDVAEIIFPKVFDNVGTLLIVKVHILLEHRKQQNVQRMYRN